MKQCMECLEDHDGLEEICEHCIGDQEETKIKVKILKSTNPISIAEWWYAEHIGEIFEVEEDTKQEEYYKTIFEGKEHGILKGDCEKV